MIKLLINSKPARMREESIKAPESKWTTSELCYGGLRNFFYWNKVWLENFIHKVVLHLVNLIPLLKHPNLPHCDRWKAMIWKGNNLCRVYKNLTAVWHFYCWVIILLLPSLLSPPLLKLEASLWLYKNGDYFSTVFIMLLWRKK